jgi:hypothetical protein
MQLLRGVARAVLLLAVTALLFAAPGANASVDQVRGGQSGLFVPFADVVTLAQKGISISPISPAFLTFNSFQEGPALRFPISGGTVESDTMVGTVNHAGGMLIQKIDPADNTVTHELSVTNLRILNGNTLTGDAFELLAAPTADLINVSFAKDPSTGVIHFEADAQTGAATALVLNTYFETDAFVAGSILGRLKSDINTVAHVRPLGASPMRVSLVPAYAPCATPDRVHGPPLDSGSCASPSQRSTELTVGTPDANGRAASSTGSVQMKVRPGDPLTSAEDEADVRLSADITDVRRASDLSDYDGELEVRANLRLTDRLNGSGLTESTTLRDVSFEFTVPCTVTEASGIGSECSVATTADAVTPGIIDEGARAVFQLGQVTVADGGPDGVAATEPNGTFAVQGIFVP